MTFSAKFAIVFLCAAICALSLNLIPRAENARESRHSTRPVLLRKSERALWLLV
jgi:hypothetical protein